MGISTNVNGHIPVSLLDSTRPCQVQVQKVAGVFSLEYRMDPGLSTPPNRRHRNGRSFHVRGWLKFLRLRLFVGRSRIQCCHFAVTVCGS